MARHVIAVVSVALFISCGRSPESLPVARSDTSTKTGSHAEGSVSLVPSNDAIERRPGIYVATIFQRPNPGIEIETMQEIFFIETVYDEHGREAATSVPSSNWSLLPEESRLTLAGMRSGDRRRIWRCPRGTDKPCRVEDVQVFDGAEARTRPNS